jgi:serine/threonine-protein kinase
MNGTFRTVLSGKYRLGDILGRGGMGLVREAVHVERRERVAVKLLRADHAAHGEARERFLREARNLSRIDDAHVVRVLDVGEASDGRPYFVMELLEGVCFDTLLKRRALSSVGEIAELARQACVGLAAAHRSRIVHRDVKPQNLMVTADERGGVRVKILDFGIALTDCAAADEAPRLTQTQVVMGTPSYMSPEQLRAPREVDARSDVFSMAVVLYELFTGRTPWRASSPVDLVVRQYLEVPPPLDAIRPDVPRALAQIVARCLEIEPASRLADAAELAAALAPHCRPVAAGHLIVDDDDVHTVVRDVYRSGSPEDWPVPQARDLSGLLDDEAAPPIGPPVTSPPPRRPSRGAFVAVVLASLLLPPSGVLVFRYVAPHLIAKLSSK